MADAEIARVLKAEYPRNTPVRWKRNGIHEGVILAHSGGDRVMVRNARTNRDLWIYAYCIADLL
jgi:hypothetical protein